MSIIDYFGILITLSFGYFIFIYSKNTDKYEREGINIDFKSRFYHESTFPKFLLLKENIDKIRSEGVNACIQEDKSNQLIDYPLIYYNELISVMRGEVCPITCKLLQSLGDVKIAGYSLLRSGGYIKPNDIVWDSNDSNKSLTYNLCLLGNSILNVDRQLVEQNPGKGIIFNSKYVHSTRNPFKGDRLILYIEFFID